VAVSSADAVKRRPLEVDDGKESAVADDMEPIRIVKLGDTRLYIGMLALGRYLLHRSDGTPVGGAFTRADAGRFAQDLLQWAREAEAQG
jgi:hypothetical protein